MAYRYHDLNKQIMEFLREYRDAKCACTSVTMSATANSELTIAVVFEAVDRRQVSVNIENKIHSQFLDGAWRFDATEQYYDIASEPYDERTGDNWTDQVKSNTDYEIWPKKVIVSKARSGRNENLF